MNPIQKAAQDWEASAIASCMKDPAYAAKVASGGWCASCDMSRPCLCDDDKIARKMLDHWKKHPRGNLERAKSRSWGQGEPMHELMLDLLRIVENEIAQIKKPRT
jgi:hypothetical protein